MKNKKIIYFLFCILVLAAVAGGIVLIEKKDEEKILSETEETTAEIVFEPVEQELESTELTDALYDERWTGKKQLIWINELTSNFDTDIIVKLNDTLMERGYDFVIRYKEEDTYSDDFITKMKEMKESGEAMDLFNIGGVYEGDPTNRYEECVSAGLLCSWDEYLQTEDGKAMKEIFPNPIWDLLKIDGSVYSYDWRTLPCKNLNGYVNQEYAEKYHITEKTTLKELEGIIQTIPDKEKLQIIWADSDLVETWGNQELVDFVSNSEIPIKQYHEINWESVPEFFMIIQSENFITSSHAQLLLGNRKYDIVKMKLADGELSEVTNNLLGIASWSQNQKEAFTFITLVNTDEEIANLLQYGIEGRNYEVEGDVVKLINQKTGLGEWTISNKRISLRQGMEPEGKAEFYKKYMDMLIK